MYDDAALWFWFRRITNCDFERPRKERPKTLEEADQRPIPQIQSHFANQISLLHMGFEMCEAQSHKWKDFANLILRSTNTARFAIAKRLCKVIMNILLLVVIVPFYIIQSENSLNIISYPNQTRKNSVLEFPHRQIAEFHLNCVHN